MARKKRRGNTRLQNRGIAGASLEVRVVVSHLQSLQQHCEMPRSTFGCCVDSFWVCLKSVDPNLNGRHEWYMQVIQKKRAEKPEQRQASREAALRWVPRVVPCCSARAKCICAAPEQS